MKAAIHEMRTILAVINGALRVVLRYEEEIDEDKRDELMLLAMNKTEELGRLVEKIEQEAAEKGVIRLDDEVRIEDESEAERPAP